MVQPIWLEAVSWWLHTVVVGWVLMALWQGQNSKIGARPGAIQGGVGTID